MSSRTLLLTIILLSGWFGPCGAGLLDFIDLGKPPTEKFLASPLELKLKKRAELSEALSKFEKKAQEQEASFVERREKVAQEITRVTTQKDEAVGEVPEFYAKELDLLTARRRVLMSSSEILNKTKALLQDHIRLTNEIIDDLKATKKRSPRVKLYYLRDLEEINEKIAEHISELSVIADRRKELASQRRMEEEDLATLRSKISKIELERGELAESIKKSTDKVETEKLGQELKLLRIDQRLAEDRRDRLVAFLENINFEEAFEADKEQRAEQQISEGKKLLSVIQKNLVVRQEDLLEAEEENKEARAKAQQEIETINAKRASKKNELRARESSLSKLEATYTELKEKGKTEAPKARALAAKIEAYKAIKESLEKDILQLDGARDLIEIRLRIPQVAIDLAKLLRQLQTGQYQKEDLARWFSEYTKLKSKEQREVASLDVRRNLNTLISKLKRYAFSIKERIAEYTEHKDELFKSKASAFDETIEYLNEAISSIGKQIGKSHEISGQYAEAIEYKKEIISQYDLIIKAIEAKRQFDIWAQSPKAITATQAMRALKEGADLTRDMIWRLPTYVNPVNLLTIVSSYSWKNFIGMLLMLLLYFLFLLLLKTALRVMERGIEAVDPQKEPSTIALLLKLLGVLVTTLKNASPLFYIWMFVKLDLLIDLRSLLGEFGNFRWYADNAFLVALFHISFIPVLIVFARQIIQAFSRLNEELDYIFFAKDDQKSFIALLSAVLYATVILLPLRLAFLQFTTIDSNVPEVIIATYTLILQVAGVAFLYLHKQDLLKLVTLPTLRNIIDSYYYLLFAFLLVLVLIANPYVGYSNLAWFLLYVVPVSAAILYGLFLTHYYIRRVSAYWFIEEDDGEVIDRFDHAKTYYGIFVIVSFLALGLIAIVAIQYVWGVSDPLTRLQYLLNEKWTIVVGDGELLGFIDLFILTFFITSGFLVSTLVDKFILKKLFDILRLDLGIRNTVSSILHYIIVYLVTLVGFFAIGLGDYAIYVSLLLFMAIAFAAQDFLKDIIAGFLVLLERPIEIGNFIETGDQIGTVHKISARATTLRTAKHHLVVIPNKQLINNTVINWGYGRSTVGFELKIVVSHDADQELAKKLIMDVVRNDSRILRIPAPVFRLEALGSAGMEFLIRAFISTRRVKDQWDIASDFRMQILASFREHGIEIPYPYRIIKLVDERGVQGPETTIAEDDLAEEILD